MRIPLALLVVLVSCIAHAVEPGRLYYRRSPGDLSHLWKATYAPGYEARPNISCGGIRRTGFLLHPNASSEDAIVQLPPQEMQGPTWAQQANEGTTTLALFYIGMQDGIPWGAKTNTPNGARFSFYVNDEKRFEQTLTTSTWQLCAVDLSEVDNSSVTFRFAVNSIDRNANYDWAHFAEFQVLAGQAVEDIEQLGAAKESPGLALTWIKADTPARISINDVPSACSLPAGISLVPTFYGSPASPCIETIEGKTEVIREGFAALPYRFEIESLYTSPKILYENEPIEVVAVVRNDGPGTLTKPPAIVARTALRPLNPEATPLWVNSWLPDHRDDEDCPTWPAGEVRTYTWYMEGTDSVLSDGPSCMVSIDALGDSDFLCPSVFRKGVDPSLFPAGFSVPVAPYRLPGTPFTFTLTASARDACMTIRNGEQIVATFPLAGKVYYDGDSLFNTIDFPGRLVSRQERFFLSQSWLHSDAPDSRFSGVKSVEAIDDGFRITLNSVSRGTGVVEVTSVTGSSRLKLHFESALSAMETNSLRKGVYRAALLGPTLYVGDRDAAPSRDFALLPGLEFLEGSEQSSSTRDLAPPLNDRVRPEAFKITSRLMAVQGIDSLIGLLWGDNGIGTQIDKFTPALFQSPKDSSGVTRIQTVAPIDYDLAKQAYTADFYFVLEDRASFEAHAKGQDTSRAAFVLDMYRHYFEVFGVPEPSPERREWAAEKALCAEAYLNAVGSADPPGFRHTVQTEPAAYAAHALPARLLLRDGLPEDTAKTLAARVDAVVARALKERGPGALASTEGAHIVRGETPFFEGHVGESLAALRDQAFALLDKRENGQWVWHPASPKHAALGKDGDATLGQAAFGAQVVLRAARLSGNLELRRRALDCLAQMEQYAIPRGAQTWECPLYQPDLLAAAQAVSAYCDAYAISGDRHYIEQAVYWAKTGLPFLYLWAPGGNPAMQYNTIPVFGSTFFTHSWIGLPVVWCGLVYAYALQDLAPYDETYPWKTFAQGITNSAMLQQYTDGPSKGCFPDSWNVLESTPNPADINPEDIVLNACRLRGNSAEVRTRRVPARVGESLVNSAFDIPALIGEVGTGKLGLSLEGKAGFPGYTAVVPAQMPRSVEGAGAPARDSAGLAAMAEGWLYDRETQTLIFKHTPADGHVRVEVVW